MDRLVPIMPLPDGTDHSVRARRFITRLLRRRAGTVGSNGSVLPRADRKAPLTRRLRQFLRTWLKRLAILAVTGTVLLLISVRFLQSWYPFPYDRLAQWPQSPCVEDRHGGTLLELVGPDGQWRRPVPLSAMSPWIGPATIAIEDERFRKHPGVDPVSIGRAVVQNIERGRIFSGASTLTMQLCRMVDDRPREWSAKLIEAGRALEIERRFSKDELLQQYLNLAPYGGNVRGVEAAARRYFGKPAARLSLGEAALLAGLPQSPSRYRPDRYPQLAEQRRRQVLRRMREAGFITGEQELIARLEPVVLAAGTTRDRMTHAAWQALRQRPQGGRTSLDPALQNLVEDRMAWRLAALPPETDAAVVVLDIESSQILALAGSADAGDPVDGQVNGALAPRSPGSALKPFLYAAAFETRRLNGRSLVRDEPIERAGWRPDNFDREYRGEMTIADALRESRNVPAILVTEAVGLSQCLGVLESAGLHLPSDASRRGGLTLAVGGLETNLLDLTAAYAMLGRDGLSQPPQLLLDETHTRRRALSADTCRLLNEILSTRHRIPHGLERLPPERLPWFMWKTGTSSGRRDAWAVGHNGRLAIGVWIGRFSGAGHVQYTGRDAAEPLLADLFVQPALASPRSPVPPSEWLVRHPLPLNPDRSSGPRIKSPTAEAAYLCADRERALIPVAAEQAVQATWFLNRCPVPLTDHASLELGPGHYELLCVDATGRSSRVRFTVE